MSGLGFCKCSVALICWWEPETNPFIALQNLEIIAILLESQNVGFASNGEIMLARGMLFDCSKFSSH